MKGNFIMSIDNIRKNPNCYNGVEGTNIADVLYILDYDKKHRCHHHCSDTDSSSDFSSDNLFEEIDIEPIGCFDTLGYSICCNEDGCCYKVRNDERNCYWPEFAHPRWLTCQELYRSNTNPANCGERSGCR